MSQRLWDRSTVGARSLDAQRCRLLASATAGLVGGVLIGWFAAVAVRLT